MISDYNIIVPIVHNADNRQASENAKRVVIIKIFESREGRTAKTWYEN